MSFNWPVIVITGIILVALLLFLIFRNKKDRKELVNKLNHDYPRPHHHTEEEDPDDVKGS